MIQERVRLVPVADLTTWAGPYQGDVGAAHTYLGTFGQWQVPVVVDGRVVYGQEYVEAERHDPHFAGNMAVLDLSDLGWSEEMVVGAVLGLHRQAQLQSIDQEMLVSLLTDLHASDERILTGAGYDRDDIDAIIAQLERDQQPLDGGAGSPPSLGDLEEKYGTYEDEDGWATVAIRAPQDVCAQWNEWAKGHANEAEAFEALLDGRVTMPSLDDDLTDEGAEPPPADL